MTWLPDSIRKNDDCSGAFTLNLNKNKHTFLNKKIFGAVRGQTSAFTEGKGSIPLSTLTKKNVSAINLVVNN